MHGRHVLASICTGFFLFGDSGANNAAEIAAIETYNAGVAITNTLVAQTVTFMETQAALPTDTPTPTNTNTPAPTDTPTVTTTPVIQEAAETATATTEIDGTSEFVTAEAGSTATVIAAQGTGTAGTGGTTGGTTGGAGSLPQTGIDIWTALVMALALIGALVVARRLRSN